MHAPIELAAKLATFAEAWQPRTVALYNGHDVMVAKLRGDYHWHVHTDTDDFFLVLDGELDIDLEDGSTVSLAPRAAVRRAQGRAAPPACARGSPYPADRADRHAEQRRPAHGGATPGHLKRTSAAVSGRAPARDCRPAP